MNASLISNQPEYDYRFVSYLLTEVFSKETLSESAAYESNRKHKFRNLEGNHFSFVEDVFEERTGNDKKRFAVLSIHINKKCNALRQNLRNKK